MNRLFWIGLNVVLLTVAYATTTWVTDYAPALDWKGSEADAEGADGGARAQGRALETESPRPTLASEDVDELWERTLFRPERTEAVAGTGDVPEEVAPPKPVELELIGVGKIGDKPVAIILEKARAVRRTVRRIVRTRRWTSDKNEPEEEEETKKTQHIYREGSEVGSTGYVVQEIRFTEVLLVKGDEELTLTLEAGDDQSIRRRDSAVASANARSAAMKAKEKKEETVKKTEKPGETPPPPPPPPVVAPPAAKIKGKTGVTKPSAAGKTSSTGTMSREERLKRAKLLRERILQRRAKESN